MRPLDVEILITPTCPHRRGLRRRVDALARREGIDVAVSETVIHDIRDAEARGFPGSPTVLIDGRDVQPAPAGAPVDHGLG
jgi:hypothetical protein